MMKRIEFCVLSLLCLLLCSCFDVSTSISYKNGQYVINQHFGFTISQDLLEMISEEIGERIGDEDIAELFEEIHKECDSLPKDVFTLKTTKNKDNFSFDFCSKVSRDAKYDDELLQSYQEMIPQKVDDVMIIKFFDYDERDAFVEELGLDGNDLMASLNSDTTEGLLAKIFYSSMKMRVFLDKSIVNDIMTVEFVDKNKRGVKLDYFDTGSMYVVEVPISLIQKREYEYSSLKLLLLRKNLRFQLVRGHIKITMKN